MQTFVRSPLEIFHMPQHLVIPIFQRPYVWNEENQWAPLWQDLRRLAELRLAEPATQATHFLGAVVVQASESAIGHMPASNIIDGQQRLTTLQILMDAVGAVLEESGEEALAGQLDGLTHNPANYVVGDATRLKLSHSNRDRDAFSEVMTAEAPIDHKSLKHAGSQIAKAHEYFSTAARTWLESAGGEAFTTRAQSLVDVVTRRLQLVTIDLAAHENSQEIFETLNARGTPLTAADLIKNYVFQRLAAEGADTRRSYAEHWPFESKFWEAEVSVGRYKVSRSSLFLNQWLGSRLGEEVSPQSTFTRFKTYVEHDARQVVSQLLPVIKSQAQQYEAWTLAAQDPDRQLSPPEMAFYRMRVSSVEVLKPLIIALHRPDRELPETVINEVIAIAESWMIRRQLLRLAAADMGRVISDIVRVHRDTPADELVDKVRAHFARLDVTSTYWPGDEELRSVLLEEPIYTRTRVPRLRMLLEAVEDGLRLKMGQPRISRRSYPIEHVLPQKWEDHWSVEGVEAQQERGKRVHRLGNLTLLTTKLNSSVSNGPWATKREKLRDHDTFLLNRPFWDADRIDWDESTIDQRTERMVGALLGVWATPEGHEGSVVDPRDRDDAWIELRHLLEGGFLEAGTVLDPRRGAWGDAKALVLPDGRLRVDGVEFDTPSGAGKHLRGGGTNGWYFWSLPDGRRLADLRAEYRGVTSDSSRGSFDWSVLHSLLELMPDGRWTTYANLADVVGTAAQPLGTHISRCSQCVNAHRVLTSSGAVADRFAWTDGDERRTPEELLRSEGVHVEGGHADQSKRLEVDDLRSLLPELKA